MGKSATLAMATGGRSPTQCGSWPFRYPIFPLPMMNSVRSPVGISSVRLHELPVLHPVQRPVQHPVDRPLLPSIPRLPGASCSRHLLGFMAPFRWREVPVPHFRCMWAGCRLPWTNTRSGANNTLIPVNEWLRRQAPKHIVFQYANPSPPLSA